jgi:hypothetical protein
VFGKTGTAQNPHGEAHAWFIGYMKERDQTIALAVWSNMENPAAAFPPRSPVRFSILSDSRLSIKWWLTMRRSIINSFNRFIGSLSNLNRLVLVFVALLCIIGILSVYSASLNMEGSFFQKGFGRQIIWLIAEAWWPRRFFLYRRN